MVIDVKQAQLDLEPKDDLSPYAGLWVALRNGHVVAADIDPAALRANPAVEEGDEIVPVSEKGADYFL